MAPLHFRMTFTTKEMSNYLFLTILIADIYGSNLTRLLFKNHDSIWISHFGFSLW